MIGGPLKDLLTRSHLMCLFLQCWQDTVPILTLSLPPPPLPLLTLLSLVESPVRRRRRRGGGSAQGEREGVAMVVVVVVDRWVGLDTTGGIVLYA